MFEWIKKKSSVVQTKISGLFGQSTIKPLRTVSQFLSLYEEDPFVRRGCAIIGNAAAMAEKKVVDSEGNEVSDHPAKKLMVDPNEEGEVFNFYKGTTINLILGGETFWEIVEKGNFTIPNELYNLRPDRMEITLNEKRTRINGYKYKVSMSSQDFDKDEIVHIKLYNPTNDWRGSPVIKSLRTLIDADRYGWEFIKDFLKKHGVQKGFLTTDKPINQASGNRLKAKWKKAEAGSGVPLLQGGLDWKNLARPPKESGMVDLNEHIVETKLSTIGVPPSLIKMASKDSDDMDALISLFYTFTVTPYLKVVENKINSDIMSRFDDEHEFHFDTENVGLMSYDTLVDMLEFQYDANSLTPNDIIKITGYGSPHDGGDKYKEE